MLGRVIGFHLPLPLLNKSDSVQLTTDWFCRQPHALRHTSLRHFIECTHHDQRQVRTDDSMCFTGNRPLESITRYTLPSRAGVLKLTLTDVIH